MLSDTLKKMNTKLSDVVQYSLDINGQLQEFILLKSCSWDISGTQDPQP